MNLDVVTKIQPILLSDLEEYVNLLSHLTTIGNSTKEEYKKQLESIIENPNCILIGLKNQENLLIGCATMWIEPKLIHGCSNVGHIEDVVIHPSYQNKGFGKSIIQYLVQIGKVRNCYKIILDCNSSNKVFYEKCGFTNNNLQMSLYY